MKTTITLILAFGIIGGTYVATFGAPAAILSLMPQEQSEQPGGESTERQQVRTAPEGRPRREGRPGRSSATIVAMQELETSVYEHNLRAIGSTVAARSVDVTADVSGTITKVSAIPNDRVEVGDILFQLDDRTEQLNVEIAQAELDQASQALQRYRSLANSSAVSAVDIADAEIAVRLAEGALNLARVALDERAVRAAIAGQVGLSTLDIGDRVNEGDVLVSIDALDELLIEFELPERAIGLLEVGRAIRASTPAYVGEVFDGQIVAYDSRLDSVTRSVTVQALIGNSDRRLWPGMTFSIRLEDRTDPLPTVPVTAITWTRDGAGIWSVQNGTASRVPVTILYRQGDNVWLDTDLAAGARIVTEGAQKLRDGATVRATDGPGSPPTRAADPRDEAPSASVRQRPADAPEPQAETRTADQAAQETPNENRREEDPA
ncbi:efflux RND transporter periplasmic adaptor subunit [Tateyamaria omphalii]|uniref:efflux RND transporter periplasmic adaptor subunit n=1 Tax=Tateyamaria omphalii TaxID=299262 RepID=UPI001C9A209A|nr:efflux RND transporter periplasmic adaptor subunit [Tateyamaria omphalii]MBY5933955.1 efflux RND transporter periplasmic adaptor subunit [Tateyamaria omphalii]